MKSYDVDLQADKYTGGFDPHKGASSHQKLSGMSNYYQYRPDYEKLAELRKGKEDFNKDFGSATPKNKALHDSINSKRNKHANYFKYRTHNQEPTEKDDALHRMNQDKIKAYAKKKLEVTKEAFENFFCEGKFDQKKDYEAKRPKTVEEILKNSPSISMEKLEKMEKRSDKPASNRQMKRIEKRFFNKSKEKESSDKEVSNDFVFEAKIKTAKKLLKDPNQDEELKETLRKEIDKCDNTISLDDLETGNWKKK